MRDIKPGKYSEGNIDRLREKERGVDHSNKPNGDGKQVPLAA